MYACIYVRLTVQYKMQGKILNVERIYSGLTNWWLPHVEVQVSLLDFHNEITNMKPRMLTCFQ